MYLYVFEFLCAVLEYETRIQHWKAMRRIDELIIIIPVILNLKGNLEMNLSARLGTAVCVSIAWDYLEL